MPKLADRIQETSTTTGTGTITLLGAVTGFRGFSTFTDGDLVYYVIVAVNASGVATGAWEVGTGTVGAGGTTLARNGSVLSSSNANALVNFGAGMKHVFVDVPAGPAFTPTRVPFVGVDGLLEDDAGLTYDKATDSLTTGALVVNATGSQFYAFGQTVDFLSLRSDGTSSIPTSTLDGEELLTWNMGGYVDGLGYRLGASITVLQNGAVGDTVPTDLRLTTCGSTGGSSAWIFGQDGILTTAGAVKLTAVGPDTTDAHTAVLQAYDVNGTVYRTFLELVNGNVPRCTISEPAGGMLVLIPPTADPHVVGAIWNNANTLAVSAG